MSNKRPLVLLTLRLADTYNRITELQMKQQNIQNVNTDEKGYIQVYESQDIHGYIVKKALGQGSFGRVVAAEGQQGPVAIKICRAQDYFVDAMKMEIRIFQKIAQTYPYMTANFFEEFTLNKHVCYSMQLFDQTLYSALKNTGGRGYDLPTVRVIARQFAQWLINLKSLQVVHTDMKPENMVLFKDRLDDIKLIDFGSGVELEQPTRPTYIQSRFYRAPEITLGILYSNKLDSWSVGALLIELHTCYTVFPARSSPMLMKMFVSLCGLPPQQLVLDQSLNIRTKVQKYFVKPSEQYWERNKYKLEQVGLIQEAYVYLSEEVLNCDDRPQCFKRRIEEICMSQQRFGSCYHEQRDYDQFYEMIHGLLRWNQEERWGGEEMMACAFLKGGQ